MDRFCIVGTSWQTGGMDEVARLSLSAGERDQVLDELATRFGLQELLYLGTCNRVEFAVITSPGTPVDPLCTALAEALGELDAREGGAPTAGTSEKTPLQRYSGIDAVRHLFTVASGLASAQLGEHEIRSQLRRAVSDGSEAGHTGPLLRDLANSALTAARQVHRQTFEDGSGPPSLARVALEQLDDRMEQIHDTEPTVALFGVSPITVQCAHRLARKGCKLILVNRTKSRAKDLLREIARADDLGACDAAHHGAHQALTFDEFCAAPPAAAAALSASAATEPILDETTLGQFAANSREHYPGTLRFVDMGVPANIGQGAAAAADVDHVGMDVINGRAQHQSALRQAAAEAAQTALIEEVARYQARLSAKTLGGVLQGLGDRTRSTLRTGLDEVVGCRFQELENTRCGMLDEWAQRMTQRVTHVPFVGLRALAAEHGSEAVETFLAAADPSLAVAYRQALVQPVSDAATVAIAHPSVQACPAGVQTNDDIQ